MRFPLPRFLALWLILCLALPNPVFALRPGSGIDAPKGSVRTGLEEALRPATSVTAGAEETMNRRGFLGRSLGGVAGAIVSSTRIQAVPVPAELEEQRFPGIPKAALPKELTDPKIKAIEVGRGEKYTTLSEALKAVDADPDIKVIRLRPFENEKRKDEVWAIDVLDLPKGVSLIGTKPGKVKVFGAILTARGDNVIAGLDFEGILILSGGVKLFNSRIRGELWLEHGKNQVIGNVIFGYGRQKRPVVSVGQADGIASDEGRIEGNLIIVPPIPEDAELPEKGVSLSLKQSAIQVGQGSGNRIVGNTVVQMNGTHPAIVNGPWYLLFGGEKPGPNLAKDTLLENNVIAVLSGSPLQAAPFTHAVMSLDPKALTSRGNHVRGNGKPKVLTNADTFDPNPEGLFEGGGWQDLTRKDRWKEPKSYYLKLPAKKGQRQPGIFGSAGAEEGENAEQAMRTFEQFLADAKDKRSIHLLLVGFIPPMISAKDAESFRSFGFGIVDNLAFSLGSPQAMKTNVAKFLNEAKSDDRFRWEKNEESGFLKLTLTLLPKFAGMEEVLERRDAIKELGGLVAEGQVTQVSAPDRVRGGKELTPAAIEDLVNSAAQGGQVIIRRNGSSKVDLTPPAAGAEEGQVQITTPDSENFRKEYQPRLSGTQLQQIMDYLAVHGRGTVQITAVTGLKEFRLYTEGGLAEVAGTVARANPVEGIVFEIQGNLSQKQKIPELFEAPGLIVPDKLMLPFAWPEGSRPPVRVMDPVYASDMAKIRPAGWIALSYNPTLTLQHILSQDVLLITIYDDKGTAVLIFA